MQYDRRSRCGIASRGVTRFRSHDPASTEIPNMHAWRRSVAIRRYGMLLPLVEVSPPPSHTRSWLWPNMRRLTTGVGWSIVIGNIGSKPLPDGVGGEQTIDIGKAGQITQKVAPFPGSAVP
jgi:hypothetical protein